ncbi:MAG TPA: FKBP-type peptidyl-prolyl cis-trans isomerase [Chitinophagaceae bacterium]|nr:FKBP-type peptidyl-prolyl cis-trans isomerase [Chitinophagaceae bacterium]
MKKLVLFACFLPNAITVWSQAGKNPGNTPVKIARPASTLKTLNDSASYAVGITLASFCREFGIEPEIPVICRPFIDVRDNKPLQVSETISSDLVLRLLSRQKNSDTSLSMFLDTTALTLSRNDSSYAIGLNNATFFKQQGITNFDTAIIGKALRDVLGNKPSQLDDQAATKVMNKMIILRQEEMAKPVIEAGRMFLANNKKRPGVKVTKSGLQYEIIRQGKGIRPLKTDTFICHYRGKLTDGTEFDASYNRNEPLRLGVSQVIRGRTEGLQLMPVGSKYKFYIPYELAYGPFDNPPIPGGSVLIFEVELLNVKKGKATQGTVKPVR